MKTKKIFITLIILIFITSFTNCIYATKDKTITQLGNEWLQTGESDQGIFNTDTSTQGFQEIAGLLTGIGIFVAIATGIILGIKFMFSTAEGKAEVSKLLIPYVIGVAVIVGALTIWRIAIGILDI